MNSSVSTTFHLLRINQWYKNLIIFVGLIFSNNLLSPTHLIESSLGFLLFCMVSGGEYILNDIIDREKDHLHPKKRYRPIASGQISIRTAGIIAAGLFVFSITIAASMNTAFFLLLLTYAVLMIAYTFVLKYISLVDFMIIGTGFAIRAAAGCVIIGAIISPWLILCAFLVAILLAIGKRRTEYSILGDEYKNHRKACQNISKEGYDIMLAITCSIILCSYALFTFMEKDVLMMITIPIVFYGIMRYLLLSMNSSIGEEPEKILLDPGIIGSILLWGVTVIFILYGEHSFEALIQNQNIFQPLIPLL